MAEAKEIKSFELELFPHQKLSAEMVARFVGDGGDWQDYQIIKVSGFDGSQTINLTEFWCAVFEHQKCDYQRDVVGRETIVKWSDTTVLKEHFTLIATIAYE